ncbi:MAG TPA: DNA-processing protein DprA [Gemmatimonadota bacterium]|nr:DNA-processing protein DprA [Gemmatimonadota bacterium]
MSEKPAEVTGGADPRGRAHEIPRPDRRYPELLRALEDAPEVLYARGDDSLLTATSVAVVGARKATGMGLEMGERLGAGLAAAGIVVVSGCAIGIDAAAHRGALEMSGATVAVLAGGHDVAVPPSNRGLAARILAERGCIVGEFPDGVPVARWSFPQRNRIIAGLARVVVVVEAARRSGALITARHALAAGREVMVVPGHPLQPEYAGSNALLADGAHPVLRVEDVIEELEGLPGVERARPVRRDTRMEPPHREDARTRVRAALAEVPRAPETLAANLGLPLGVVLATLTELELLGLAVACPGQHYALPPPKDKEDRKERRGGAVKGCG